MNCALPKRASGVLMHITSLPGPFSCGDIHGGFSFIDVLHSAGQQYWQVLPLTPTSISYGSSPYSSSSAFAGNPLLISPQMLFKEGLLPHNPLLDSDGIISAPKADFIQAEIVRMQFIFKAIAEFQKGQHYLQSSFETFCADNAYWLNDYAEYCACKNENENAPWWQWKTRSTSQSDTLSDLIEQQKIIQFFFFHQWSVLRKYASSKNVSIIGDIPFYVSHDSADCWSNPQLFDLNKKGLPNNVAGVPPDYFSSTGQCWGNPLYRWNKRKELFAWWQSRLQHCTKLFDITRIDHFRGFASYWSIPAGESTAIHGTWKKGPGVSFFKSLPAFSIVAEDLGTITQDVHDLLEATQIPGMSVLQFAFNDQGSTNTYLPHNHKAMSIVYSGTHDNTTLNDWFANELDDKQRKAVQSYCNTEITSMNAHKALMRLAMASTSQLCIIPMQDILGLDGSARMNIPGTAHGNWQWRASTEQCKPYNFSFLNELTHVYGRQ